MSYDEDEIAAICKVIKSHFNNLTVDQTLAITFEILRAIASIKKEIK